MRLERAFWAKGTVAPYQGTGVPGSTSEGCLPSPQGLSLDALLTWCFDFPTPPNRAPPQQMCLMPLNCALGTAKMANAMLCVFHCNFLKSQIAHGHHPLSDFRPQGRPPGPPVRASFGGVDS